MKKKILVVDDQPDVRELIVVTLQHANYEIFTAADGHEALAVAMRERPDLIVMDVAMPVIDGLEATRRLKQHPETAGCTVILLTAHAQPADEADGVAAGADSYFTKPFSPLELLRKVESVLE